MLKIEVDKTGLGYLVELLAVAGVIAVSGGFVMREISALLVPVAEETASLPVGFEPDENSFYIDPPSDKPVFLADDALAKKRDALVWEGRDFLYIDLDRAAISFYEGGALRATHPILAGGNGGSFFDPPQGLYTIQGKAENHVSQIERRRFPWAVYLFGNYLIHAADPSRSASAGQAPVQSGIRLASPDARDVYSKAQAGMPALVARAGSPREVAFAYFRKSNLPHRVPEVSAAAALAADLETGEVLFEKNENDRYPTASLTKLMTAVLVREKINPEAVLTVTQEALATYGDSAGLVKGEIFRAADLLYALLLPSSNDAAAVYESAVPDFMAQLNRKAEDLGLHRTYFADSSGLSRENVTSAADLFSLLRYIDTHHPELLALSREKIAAKMAENKKKRHFWNNINWPADDKRFLGGKAGFTDDSLQTMAGVWRIRVSEYGGRRIAIAVLGSRNRIRDVRAIINYLEQDFVYGFAASDEARRPRPISLGASVFEAIAPRFFLR